VTPVTGSKDPATDPAMGYEEARAALAEVVAALESGDATLEEALALWERGEAYAQACERWLAGARERLDGPGDGEITDPQDPAGPSD